MKYMLLIYTDENAWTDGEREHCYAESTELTHDLNILPGLFIGCVASEVVTVLLLRRSILTEKVARRGHHLVREYSVDPFEIHRVGEIMETNPPAIPAAMTVKELADRMTGSDRWLVGRQGAPRHVRNVGLARLWPDAPGGSAGRNPATATTRGARRAPPQRHRTRQVWAP